MSAKDHPVPQALEAFEEILQGCRKLALTLALNELEETKLAELTDQLLDLHDEFGDRALVEALDANPQAEDRGDFELTATRARIKQRLLKQLMRNDQPNLQEIALKLIP
ncbi:MAG: hypothetical protein L0170_18820, partial [Acidobacteria bacterium]|nr:hypothetical protein [Acidobacteriota bacterium]